MKNISMDFQDKRVLVTGATRGIGRAIAEAFLDRGAYVAVTGSTDESTEKAVSELRPVYGERVLGVAGSIAEVSVCEKIVESTVSAFGGLDTLVNNAGASKGMPISKVDEATWDHVVDVNLKGTFFLCKYAHPHLRESRGSIVNIASVLGLVGFADSGPYCASKGGVVNLTRALALEFGPDVRVNAVCPGGIETEMLRRLAVRLAGNVEDGLVELGKYTSALLRVGQVEEIAAPVLYLASDMASFVSGSIHAVDGGETCD